jgi:hypothetical protein
VLEEVVGMENRDDSERMEPVVESSGAEERGCGDCPVKVWTEALRDARVSLHGIMPAEFWQHQRAAHKEALLALRSLLDAAIERVDKEPAPRSRRAPTRIAVK